MNKEEAIKKIGENENADLEVFTSDEHKTYLENFAKQKVEDAKSEVTKNIHSQYDETLNKHFGTDRNRNEKTYNFLDRKVTELKDESKQSEPLKVKIKELESAIKNNTGDELLKTELQTVRNEYKKEKDIWDAKELKHLDALDTFKLDTELDKAMIGLKFKDDVPDDLKNVFIDKVKSDLVKSAKIVDSKMIFVDSDGKTLVNKDNALNPFTPKEMMAKELASILSKVDKQNGTIKPTTKIVDGKEVLDLTDPGVKTREEVTKYLAEMGVPRSSKEYMVYYKEFTKDIKAL